ncbi:MAG: hypothetical protein ABIR54_17655 [Burkholderiaceae bacterium]
MPHQKQSEPPAIGLQPTLTRAISGLVVLAQLWGCTPTFDWRSVALPDTQLVTELPCRPSRFQRDLVVAEVPLKLFMLSCETGGVTYGVATAEVGDPVRVDAVLVALRASAAAAIRSADPHASALNLSGVTPFSGNSSAHLHGQRPDGETVDESVRVFARGTRIFQVSAVGATLPEVALKPFEDGLRFDLEKRVADPT